MHLSFCQLSSSHPVILSYCQSGSLLAEFAQLGACFNTWNTSLKITCLMHLETFIFQKFFLSKVFSEKFLFTRNASLERLPVICITRSEKTVFPILSSEVCIFQKYILKKSFFNTWNTSMENDRLPFA